MRTECRYCFRLVFVLDGFIVNHKEPESTALCYGSGCTPVAPTGRLDTKVNTA